VTRESEQQERTELDVTDPDRSPVEEPVSTDDEPVEQLQPTEEPAGSSAERHPADQVRGPEEQAMHIEPDTGG
jgi:hypothetical protein